jgi:hypothetical protein
LLTPILKKNKRYRLPTVLPSAVGNLNKEMLAYWFANSGFSSNGWSCLPYKKAGMQYKNRRRLAASDIIDCADYALTYGDDEMLSLLKETNYDFSYYYLERAEPIDIGSILANTLLDTEKLAANDYYQTNALIEAAKTDQGRQKDMHSQAALNSAQANIDQNRKNFYEYQQYIKKNASIAKAQNKSYMPDCGAYSVYDATTRQCKGKDARHAQHPNSNTLKSNAPVLYESLSYCRESKNSKWACDGLTQNTIIPETLDVSLRQSGCYQFRMYLPFKDGRLYFCTDKVFNPSSKSGRATWNRDISQWLDIPESMLNQRKKLQ